MSYPTMIHLKPLNLYISYRQLIGMPFGLRALRENQFKFLTFSFYSDQMEDSNQVGITYLLSKLLI